MSETPEACYGRKRCRHGEMLFNRHDRYLGRSLDLYGEFSEGEITLFQQVLRPGKVALDIGANIGCHTLPMARLVQPGGYVVAFEPQRLVFQMLCANLALNEVFNVTALQRAVGEARGRIRVPVLDPRSDQNFGGLDLRGRETGEAVEVIRVDDLNLTRCDLLKADVEGMEPAVLRGARATIERFRPVLYVENDRKENAADLARLIDELGYRAWWHTPPLFQADNFAGNPENVFGEIRSINLLCLPRESTVGVEGLRPFG